LTAIAHEKAGIIKPGRPVVSSQQRDEALTVIEETAAERNAPLTLIGRDILFSPVRHSLDGQTLIAWSAEEQKLVTDFIELEGRTQWKPRQLNIPLLGYHQVENAATAYAVLRVASENGLQITEDEIAEGFEKVTWPGRFEVLRRDPPLVVDSAHNPDSALKLRLALEDYFHGLPVVLLFGASEDKDIRGMFRELLPRIRRVVATESTHPRAMEAEKIVDLAHQFGVPAQVALPVEGGLAKALELAGNEAAVVATGSLFIAAAARHAWFQMSTSPQAAVRQNTGKE
jgi:dihydrofolate synthase/folylpolyglutamate synthase